jgi:hypothetical protein
LKQCEFYIFQLQEVVVYHHHLHCMPGAQ